MSLDRAAYPFAVPLALAAAVLGFVAPWLAAVPGALLLFTLWFFRDPDRSPPPGPGIVLSPADGKIIRADASAVSIFMNVFDVHVCRAPSAGRVMSVRHHSGRFLAAFKDEAPIQNERIEIVLRGDDGDLRLTLIAGLVARRIVCRVAEGQTVDRGDRVGVIRFGSRVDVEVPAGVTVCVRVGRRVVAGESVLAQRRPAS